MDVSGFFCQSCGLSTGKEAYFARLFGHTVELKIRKRLLSILEEYFQVRANKAFSYLCDPDIMVGLDMYCQQASCMN